jgi:hypothetical protein
MQAVADAVPLDTRLLVFQRDPKTVSLATPTPRPDQAHPSGDTIGDEALRMGTEFVTGLSGLVVGFDVGIHAGTLLGGAIGTLLAPGMGTVVGETLGTLGEVVGMVSGSMIGAHLGEKGANTIVA